tara:strand:- start:71 stop:982 length:912 start_codon:yes stop_codon:yes gene_type:complete
MDLKSKIILIAGPTASGKSKFAVKLAKKANGEIINADSMQVYKELKILTARPKKIDQKKIKHHLYGIQSVKKDFSSGKWLKHANKKIKEIRKRNKIPIFVGGTGLYFKSLTDGLSKIPNIPINFRNKIRNLQKNIGQEKFYNKLIKLDPKIKNYAKSNDVQRSIRAYEIKKYTKLSILDWFEKTKKTFNQNEFLKIYIDFPRYLLLKRISKRIDQMFKEKVINEVIRFNELKVKKDKSANNVIGIKEITLYTKNIGSLEDTKDKILIKTRQYAKRQTTWARGQMQTWIKLDPENLNSYIKNLS